MLSLRRIARTPAVQKIVGLSAAQYLRFAWLTSRLTVEPADLYEWIDANQPFILAMWHGQHFMTPFISRGHRVKVLISRHRDGEINAYAAERLGIQTVRGSGDQNRRFDVKGGVGAFRRLLSALEDGYIVALTADVPKVARVAGLGIVMLGRMSGRPIYPAAVATSRRIVLRNWDRSAVNLPFSRIAIVGGTPVAVPADADDAGMEECRAALERGLGKVTERAYEIVDRKDRHADRG
jgi:lysophospholipid acyltransferase (LPLAT)-like uncharacterized protein